MSFRFELLKTYEECYHFQELTNRIWGGGPADETPIHILVTIGKNGGGVLAALNAPSVQVRRPPARGRLR